MQRAGLFVVQITGDSHQAGDLKEDVVTMISGGGNPITEAAEAARSEAPAPEPAPVEEQAPAAQKPEGEGAGASGDGEPTAEQLKTENAALKKSLEDERSQRIGRQRQAERDQGTQNLRDEVAGLKRTVQAYVGETARGSTPEELSAALAKADEETAKAVGKSLFEVEHAGAAADLREALTVDGKYAVDTTTSEFQAVASAWDDAVANEDSQGLAKALANASRLALAAHRAAGTAPAPVPAADASANGEGAAAPAAAAKKARNAMDLTAPPGGPAGADESWRNLSPDQKIAQGHAEAMEAEALA